MKNNKIKSLKLKVKNFGIPYGDAVLNFEFWF